MTLTYYYNLLYILGNYYIDAFLKRHKTGHPGNKGVVKRLQIGGRS
jgi:hypothetical protein